ncbi:unnamed protein product [Boreogadus saida]
MRFLLAPGAAGADARLGAPCPKRTHLRSARLDRCQPISTQGPGQIPTSSFSTAQFQSGQKTETQAFLFLCTQPLTPSACGCRGR